MYASLIFFALIVITFGAHLPPELQTCKASDPKFAECLIKSGHQALQILAKGNKGLKLPAIDPLVVPVFEVPPAAGPINLAQKYTNSVLSGLSTMKINSFLIGLKECSIYMNSVIPRLTLHAEYEYKGHLLLFPINSKGIVNGDFDGMGIVINATCERFKKGDVEYIRLISNTLKFIKKKVKFDIGTLIDGNADADREVHKLVNDDPEAFYEVLRPAAEELWSDMILQYVNNIFTVIPVNQLF